MKAFLYCKGVIRTRSKAETVRSYFVEALARATRHELRTSPCLTAHLAAFDCFAPLARRFLRQIFVKMTQLYKRIARKMSKKMPKRFRQRRGSYCSLTVYGVGLQFKMDIRSKTMLVTCYLVPLVFFFFMSGIFTSIDPTAKETLIPSMSVFVVTMSALIGLPPSLGEVYGGEVKKVYRANGVPLSLGVITQFVSSFIHTLIVCLIVFAVAPFAFGAGLPNDLPLYFCSLAVLLCATLAIGCIIGLSVRTQAKQTMVAMVVFLPSVMLSGIMFPSAMLPEWMQYFACIFPATVGFQAMTAFAAWQIPVLLGEFALFCAVWALLLNRTARS